MKSIEFISSDDSLLKKKAKANFKVLGPKYGKNMKEIAAAVSKWTNEEIAFFEKNNGSSIFLENKEIKLSLEDVEITTADVPGWEIATNGTITVALDISLTNELLEEGVSRDFVNKVQNKRKELGLEVSDFIKILVCAAPETKNAINNNLNYICSETLTKTLDFVENINGDSVFVDDDIKYVIEKLK